MPQRKLGLFCAPKVGMRTLGFGPLEAQGCISPFSKRLSMFATFFKVGATKSLISVPATAKSFNLLSKTSILPLVNYFTSWKSSSAISPLAFFKSVF